jgi:hypothetical protein
MYKRFNLFLLVMELLHYVFFFFSLVTVLGSLGALDCFDQHTGSSSTTVVGDEDSLSLEDPLDVLELCFGFMLLLMSSFEEGTNEERGAGTTWSEESLRETF